MFSKVFTPLAITPNVTLKNRLVMAPMGTNYASNGGFVSERNKLYYKTRAMGGVGMIIVEAAHLNSSNRHRPNGICISDEEHLPGLADLTAEVHNAGAHVVLQLIHSGRIASSKVTGVQPVSASAIPHPISGEVPHPLTMEEIRDIQDRFVEAAARAKRAGFDGVELHGGHGYLLGAFTSPYSNKRTDEYGGDLSNRMRFPLEIVRKMRETLGRNYLISYRLSGDEFLPEGFGLREAQIFAVELEKAGVNLLHVSAGINEQPRTMAQVIPFSHVSPGCFAYLSAAIKNHVKIPVITVGRINSPEIAEKILECDQADLVALGRSLIADPYWPKKAFDGRISDINKCLACNEGCIERLNKNSAISCAVNPWVGTPEELDPLPNVTTVPPKHALVVGGGPSGMKAAYELAKRGHKVTLYEKGSKLGGQIMTASRPPGKSALMDLVAHLEGQLKKLGVDIILGREATAAEITALNADSIILATGSVPVVPPIKGISGEKVVVANEVLDGVASIPRGSKVVIIGGGMIGLETAHYLAANQNKITIVEMADVLGANVNPMIFTVMMDIIKENNIKTLLKTEVREIKPDGAVVVYRKEQDKADTITDVDYVVVAVGCRPNNSLAKQLQGDQVYAIGDCRSTGKIIDAITEGARIGLEVATK